METENKNYLLQINMDLQIMIEDIDIRTNFCFSDYELLLICRSIFEEKKLNTYKLSDHYVKFETEYINFMLEIIKEKI